MCNKVAREGCGGGLKRTDGQGERDACRGQRGRSPVDCRTRGGGWGHPRDYSDFKGLVFGICRRHKRTATLNWMSFEFIDFTIAANVVPRARRSPLPRVSVAPGPLFSRLTPFKRGPRLFCFSLSLASGRPSVVAVKFPKVRRETLSFA